MLWAALTLVVKLCRSFTLFPFVTFMSRQIWRQRSAANDILMVSNRNLQSTAETLGHARPDLLALILAEVTEIQAICPHLAAFLELMLSAQTGPWSESQQFPVKRQLESQI